jgi:hypothetical protein
MEQLLNPNKNSAYVLRSTETADALDKLAANNPFRIVRDEIPGDFVVSRDMRAVYMIAGDGSRRRIRDPKLMTYVTDHLKGKIQDNFISAEFAAARAEAAA